MKVIGPESLMFDHSVSDPWGWGWPLHHLQRFTRPGFQYRVLEEERGSRQIPISFEGRNTSTSDFDDLMVIADSDSDSEDANNNGPKSRKRQHKDRSSSLLKEEDTGHYGNVVDLDSLVNTDGASGTTEPATEPDVQVVDSGSDIRYKVRCLEKETGRREKEINGTPNYSIYKYLAAFLEDTQQQIDGIKGDGNCFFRALSKVVFGTETMYDDIRQAVCDVMEKYPKKFEQFCDEKSMHKHVSKMRENKVWATQTEIYAAATLLQREMYILSPDRGGETDENYRWLMFSPQFKYSCYLSCHPCFVTLCHTHGNHYDRIAPFRGRCNCDMEPPKMSGVKTQVDLTTVDVA